MSRARDLADGTFSGAFSADSPTLVVDATNDSVGIGTTTTTNGKTVVGLTGAVVSGNTDGATIGQDGVFNLIDTTNWSSTNSTIFLVGGGYGGVGQISSAIGFARQSNIDWGTQLRFYTHSINTSDLDELNERMRLDAAGNLVLGKTSAGSISNFGNEMANAGYAMHSRSAGCPLFLGRAVSTGDMVAFYYGSSTPDTFRGSISTNGTSISYNTSSDYRLKENVTDLTGAIDRVKQVPVHRFNFISDPDKTVDGFLAHEVQAVVPEAVTSTKDGMKTEEYEVTPAVLDDDGNVVTEAVMGTREVPEYQGIDQSKLVPLLTAAIKEQQALIEDLQTRLAALEAV